MRAFRGSITMPDGRACSVLFTRHGSGPAGTLEITDAGGALVYQSSASSQSDAVFNFYLWLKQQEGSRDRIPDHV